MAMISLKNVNFAYASDSIILAGYSASLLSRGTLALLGPSGVGKTTLLRLIAGLEIPQSGSIIYDPPSPVISFVFQDPVLFEHYSRYENAMYRSMRGLHRNRFDHDRFARIARILSLDGGFLDKSRPLRNMSGGERQRLVLLRELSIAPDLLILDEPCAGLDPVVKREFLLLLAELLEGLNLRCIYTTHHLDEIVFLADDVLYLHETSGSCTGVVQPFDQFLMQPPTLDAAIMTHGSTTSVLRGILDGPLTAHDGAAFLIQPTSKEREYALVFPQGCATFSSNGLPHELVIDNGVLAIVSVGGQHMMVSGFPRTSSVLIEGRAHLYFRGMFDSDVSVRTIIDCEAGWRLMLRR